MPIKEWFIRTETSEASLEQKANPEAAANSLPAAPVPPSLNKAPDLAALSTAKRVDGVGAQQETAAATDIVGKPFDPAAEMAEKTAPVTSGTVNLIVNAPEGAAPAPAG